MVPDWLGFATLTAGLLCVLFGIIDFLLEQLIGGFHPPRWSGITAGFLALVFVLGLIAIAFVALLQVTP